MSHPSSPAAILPDLPGDEEDTKDKGSEAQKQEIAEPVCSEAKGGGDGGDKVKSKIDSASLGSSNVREPPVPALSSASTAAGTTAAAAASLLQLSVTARPSLLNPGEAQPPQVQPLEGIRRKSTGILGKQLVGKRTASLEMEGAVVKTERVSGAEGGSSPQAKLPLSATSGQTQHGSDSSGAGSSATLTMTTTKSITPSIVKPRRPSVHFAVDADAKAKAVGIPERVRQDSGGSSSRKHRSRKEKLVCRSESPTDTPMDISEASRSLLSPLYQPGGGYHSSLHQHSASSLSVSASPSPVIQDPLGDHSPSPSQGSTAPKPSSSTVLKPKPPFVPTSKTPSKAGTASTRVKPRVKRTSTGTGLPRGSGNSRKSSSNSLLSNNASSSIWKEPVRKKKVIEIVSPGKRKTDHLDIVKTSSDPIFVRAANKPMKNKPTRLRFSRANLHKSNASGFQQRFGSQQRVRHSSSSSFQLGSSARRVPMNKQRLSGSPQKKEPEAEDPTLPPAFVDDLMWLLKDAESEFGPGRSSKQVSSSEAGGSGLKSHLPDTPGYSSVVDPLPQPLSSSLAAASRLTFGRRRVESEPPGAVGFEMAPGSPTGSTGSIYPIRKDLYFSPSPSYTAPGPSGRRRYSRRRHAKIHPPFEETNCNFQGHFCPNPKVPRSLYCEKHLDQGPTAGYSHCRYMKDGRHCGSIVPSFDTVSYCEKHANIIAKSEYELRNPKDQPDQAKQIISKISKIYKEGLTKTSDGVDTSVAIPDVFQIVEEPDIVQELPLGSYTGGLVEELDAEGERNVNPDKPDYDALKNAGYFTTEEIIQIHINKLKKLKALYQREKELEWLTRQQKLRFCKEGLEKLKLCGPKYTTNPYLINTNVTVPPGYIDHQIKQYDAAKAILQTAYKADGQRGLLRLKMLQKSQELARKAKASGQKQHDAVDAYDSDTDGDSDGGESRDRLESTRYSGLKSYKCAYNEGYAVRPCQNSPVYWSGFCLKHILSDTKQVQWVPCKRSIGPDPQDICKTPCFRILEKHGCPLHSPLMMTKHKPLRRSEEELNNLADSDNEEEELTLENESNVLANLVTDECLSMSHLDEVISKLNHRGPLDVTDTSDSEETDEEGLAVGSLLANDGDGEDYMEEGIDSPASAHA